MDLYDNNPVDRMWFGTEQKMGWIETPQTGADVSSIGQSANAVLENGGGTVRTSWDSHKVYQFSWGVGAPPNLVSLLQSYRNGSYGRGLLWFHDPMFYSTNLLPKRWADPSMAVNFEAEPLIPDVWPTASPVTATSNNYPVNAAVYGLPSSYSSQTNSSEHFIPIPDGMSLALGAAYSSPNGGTVYVRTPAGITDLVPMSTTGQAVVNTVIRNQPWARLGIRNTPGATSIYIIGMSARLSASIPASDGQPFSYTNLMTNPSMEAGAGAAEIRRNLIQPDTITTTGWTPTSGTIAAVGGRLQFTSNGGSAVRLGATSAMAVAKPTGAWVASFRAQTSDPNLTGVRVYLYDTVSATIRAQQSIPIVPGGGENKYDFTLTAVGGTFNQVYMEFYGTAITNGAVGYLSEPILEAGTVFRPFFNGAIRPKYRRNLAVNPRATTLSGWLSNNISTNPLIRGVASSVPHPLGITTVAEQSSTGTNSALGTVYNFDSLANVGTPARALGMWFLVNEPGYRVGANNGWVGSDELPVNQWTFVKNGTAAAGAYAIVTVQKISGNASTTARVQMTGALVEEGTGPVGDYFDGTTVAPAGFETAWVSTVNNSASYMYDTDLTPVWAGVAGASESSLTGIAVTSTLGSNVVRFQSTRWASTGTKSMRIRTVGSVGSTSVIVQNLTAADAGKTLVILVKLWLESPTLVEAAYARSLFIVVNGATAGTIQGPQAPNAAGLSELRWEVAIPADLTAGTIRVFHGGAAGDVDMWVDDFAVVEAPYDGNYFDGSFPGSVWNGTPNASTSTLSGVNPINGPIGEGPWYSGEGHSGCRFQGNPTVINYNGVNGGQIGLSAVLQEVGAWE